MLAVIFVIALGLGIFVMVPLLATGREEGGTLPVDVTPSADLKRRRMVVYENMRDLEFEFQARKIAPKDFESLRESYKAEAAKLMVAAQELERGAMEDRFIEREVAARRARVKNSPPPSYLCSKCGFENPVPVKFCGDCGAPMAKAGG
jgi:hypothetical protein